MPGGFWAVGSFGNFKFDVQMRGCFINSEGAQGKRQSFPGTTVIIAAASFRQEPINSNAACSITHRTDIPSELRQLVSKIKHNEALKAVEPGEQLTDGPNIRVDISGLVIIRYINYCVHLKWLFCWVSNQ
jgi:hypothetical protein